MFKFRILYKIHNTLTRATKLKVYNIKLYVIDFSLK